MDLEVFEEGYGRVELTREVPPDILHHLIVPAIPLVLVGKNLRALLLEFVGEGFQAWFNRLWAAKPLVVSTRAEMAVLELRVAWRHRIKGTWDTTRVWGHIARNESIDFYPLMDGRHFPLWATNGSGSLKMTVNGI